VARLTSVAILKGIQQIEIPLDDVALLIGANNSGKASQLCTSDAQSRALGKQYWKRTAKLLLEYGACSGNAVIRAASLRRIAVRRSSWMFVMAEREELGSNILHLAVAVATGDTAPNWFCSRP
jgi:hypothetical protein